MQRRLPGRLDWKEIEGVIDKLAERWRNCGNPPAMKRGVREFGDVRLP